MKQIIIVISAIAMALAEPPAMDPNCMPFNLPKNASFQDCCQLKVEMLPADILKKCEAQFPMPATPLKDGPQPLKEGPPQGCCITECVMKELKVFVDGKIDKNIAITLLSGKDASLKSTVEKAVDFCLEKTAKLPTPPPPPGNQCSMLPMLMVGCVYGQIYKDCGAQIVSSKPECAALSDFAKKCEWVPPMLKN